MKVTVVGSHEADSKVVADALDKLFSKLKNPVVMFVPSFKFISGERFLEQYCFTRMFTYEIYHEGMEKMMENADALITFGGGEEVQEAVCLAEKRGIKIKRIK